MIDNRFSRFQIDLLQNAVFLKAVHAKGDMPAQYRIDDTGKGARLACGMVGNGGFDRLFQQHHRPKAFSQLLLVGGNGNDFQNIGLALLQKERQLHHLLGGHGNVGMAGEQNLCAHGMNPLDQRRLLGDDLRIGHHLFGVALGKGVVGIAAIALLGGEVVGIALHINAVRPCLHRPQERSDPSSSAADSSSQS